MQFHSINEWVETDFQESLFYETPESLQEDVVRNRINQLEYRLPIRAFNFTYTKKVSYPSDRFRPKDHSNLQLSEFLAISSESIARSRRYLFEKCYHISTNS